MYVLIDELLHHLHDEHHLIVPQHINLHDEDIYYIRGFYCFKITMIHLLTRLQFTVMYLALGLFYVFIECSFISLWQNGMEDKSNLL